jgi:hypothetical protein
LHYGSCTRQKTQSMNTRPTLLKFLGTSLEKRQHRRLRKANGNKFGESCPESFADSSEENALLHHFLNTLPIFFSHGVTEARRIRRECFIPPCLRAPV